MKGHLEANARFLRDPKLLQTLYQYFERHYGMTTQGIQMIVARAGETLEFANACLADVNDRDSVSVLAHVQLLQFERQRVRTPATLRSD